MVGVRMNKEINTIIANLEGCIGMFDYLLTPTESNLLVAYIKQLQQENKQLKDELKEELEWSIGIVEHNRILSEKNKEIHQLKDNWNYIKKMLKEARQEKYISGYCGTCTDVDIDFLLGKMQEIEGNDSDE